MTVSSKVRQLFPLTLALAAMTALACNRPGDPVPSDASATATESPAPAGASAPAPPTPAGAPIIETSASADQPTRILDPRADEILRAMSTLLASTPRYAFEAEEEFDEIPSGQPRVSLSNLRRVVVQRPNKVAVDTEGDSLNRSVWFDGRTFALLDKSSHTYATVPIAGSIDQAFDTLGERYGVSVPLVDLLYADPHAVLTETVTYSRYLGLHRAAGRLCHHLVFAQPTIEWQMWIDAGERPLPVKMIITYVREPGEPQYTATFAKWTLSPQVPDTLFQFDAPEGAERVDATELVPRMAGATSQ
jgi:hypothetical protein